MRQYQYSDLNSTRWRRWARKWCKKTMHGKKADGPDAQESGWAGKRMSKKWGTWPVGDPTQCQWRRQPSKKNNDTLIDHSDSESTCISGSGDGGISGSGGGCAKRLLGGLSSLKPKNLQILLQTWVVRKCVNVAPMLPRPKILPS